MAMNVIFLDGPGKSFTGNKFLVSSERKKASAFFGISKVKNDTLR